MSDVMDLSSDDELSISSVSISTTSTSSTQTELNTVLKTYSDSLKQLVQSGYTVYELSTGILISLKNINYFKPDVTYEDVQENLEFANAIKEIYKSYLAQDFSSSQFGKLFNVSDFDLAFVKRRDIEKKYKLQNNLYFHKSYYTQKMSLKRFIDSLFMQLISGFNLPSRKEKRFREEDIEVFNAEEIRNKAVNKLKTQAKKIRSNLEKASSIAENTELTIVQKNNSPDESNSSNSSDDTNSLELTKNNITKSTDSVNSDTNSSKVCTEPLELDRLKSFINFCFLPHYKDNQSLLELELDLVLDAYSSGCIETKLTSNGFEIIYK